MYSHIYGKKHFPHKTNFGDMVVFSDVNQNKIKSTAPENNNIYVEIEKGYNDPKKWYIHFNRTLSGEYGDFFLIQGADPVGTTNQIEYEITETTRKLVNEYILTFQNGQIPYYSINDRTFIRLDKNFVNEEVFIGKGVKSKPNHNAEYDAFVTLFISEDGARLEHAYQNITEVNDHEVLIFIERNAGTNAFGTVFRLKKGGNVKTLPETDRITVAKIARAYGVDVITNELTTMIQEELRNENSWFYLLLLQGAQGSGKVIRWSTDITLSTLKEGVNTVSKELEQLKLGAEYWKTLTDDGKENPKFKSLLPKLTKGAIINTETFVKNTYKTYFHPLENKVSYLEKLFKQHAFLGKIIPFNTDKIVSLLQSIPELLQSFFTKVQNSLISFYNFINGLLVGLINSIIEFIKSVFDILALLIGILNGSIQSTKFFENPTSYLSLFVESIENTIDSVYNAFTKENFKKLLDFLSNLPKQAGMLLTSITNKIGNTVTDPGAIGYYLGFLVGFIASEVVTFFATGGAGNIAKALKAVLQSYKSLVKTTAKTVQKTITFSMNTFVSLVKKILEFSKNIPKHLDTLKAWIDEFISKLSKVSNQLFKGFEAALDLLFDLGVVISQKLDPNTGKVIVQGVDGAIYTIKQGDKTILEGTEDAIRKFAQKIDEIRASGGNTKKKVQNHLDELAENLNTKHKEFFDSKNLKLEKPKGARNNLQIVDDKGDVYFYGKPDQIDEYIRLVNRTDTEKLIDFKKVIDYFNSSKARYRKEKNWEDGSILKFSTHNTPSLSVDFKHTPQFLYGKKNGKPGVVKIKLTGNDEIDFKMAFKKSGISDELAKKIKKEFTWHHLDDFDPLTGQCTMQLVSMRVHKASCPHIGGAGLYKAFMGVGYPNRKINIEL